MGIKIAVIGLGKMGLLHASILNVLEKAEVVVLCEKSWLMRRFASKIIPDIPFVASVEDLSGMKLDAVYVTTPDFSHSLIVETIYNERIARNVFVEKPLALNYYAAQELCKLATRAGGVTMVGYNRRYSTTFIRAKQVLDDNVLGEVASFEGHAFSSDFLGTRVDSRASAKSKALSDLGCHIIDLALWLFGQLEANSGLLDPNIEPEDWVHFKVRSANNSGAMKGDIKISRSMKDYRLPEISLLVRGSKGMMKVDEDKVELKLDGEGSVQLHKHDLGDDVPFLIGGSEYLREDRYFIDSIVDGFRAEPDFQEASRVEAMIDQITDETREPQQYER